MPSVVLNPVLPSLGLHPGAPSRAPRPFPHPESPDVAGPAHPGLEATPRRRQAGSTPPAAVPASEPGPPGEPLTFGFYVNWDPGSQSSLEANLDALDVLLPEWLHVAGPDGTVTEDEPARQKEVREYLRAHRPGLRVMPLLNNYDDNAQRWDGGNLARVLEQPARRARLVRQLMAYLRQSASAGLVVDFQELPAESLGSFHAFLGELAASLHPAAMRLAVTAPAASPACDYRELSRIADDVVLAIYDQHWPGGPDGSLAAAGWFSDVLRLRRQDVPPDKMVIGRFRWMYGTEQAVWRHRDCLFNPRHGALGLIRARPRRRRCCASSSSMPSSPPPISRPPGSPSPWSRERTAVSCCGSYRSASSTASSSTSSPCAPPSRPYAAATSPGPECRARQPSTWRRRTRAERRSRPRRGGDPRGGGQRRLARSPRTAPRRRARPAAIDFKVAQSSARLTSGRRFGS